MSTDILFLAEFAGGSPARSALELATGAAELASQSGGQAVGLAYGPGAASGAASLGAQGAARVVVLGDEDRPAITYAPAAIAAARGGGLALLAPATPNGRDLAAALVGSLDLPAFGPVRAARVTDGVVETEQATLQGSRHHHQPAGGRRADPRRRPRAGQHVHPGRGWLRARPRLPTRPPRPSPRSPAQRVAERHEADAKVVNLEEATVIVAGGRGVGGEEGFGPLRDLAASLGGAVGASRAAADAGWIPYQLQIGQTGKVVKPALYIGAGISGAIQHRVGMQSADHVVAINRDPDAPIGEFADLFVVGDLFQIVPALTDEIRRRTGKQE